MHLKLVFNVFFLMFMDTLACTTIKDWSSQTWMGICDDQSYKLYGVNLKCRDWSGGVECGCDDLTYVNLSIFGTDVCGLRLSWFTAPTNGIIVEMYNNTDLYHKFRTDDLGGCKVSGLGLYNDDRFLYFDSRCSLIVINNTNQIIQGTTLRIKSNFSIPIIKSQCTSESFAGHRNLNWLLITFLFLCVSHFIDL